MNIHPQFSVFGDSRPIGYSDNDILLDVRLISEEVELLYGPMVEDWTIRFLVFVNESTPCIYYPKDFNKTVGIRLVGPALKDVDFARFQMAHELVHCLSPFGGCIANVLEEGMAAFYQQNYSEKMLGSRVQLGDKRYVFAMKLYEKFLKECNMSNPIAKLRSVEPYVHKFTHETFITAGIILPEYLEKLLLMRFEDLRKTFDNLRMMF